MHYPTKSSLPFNTQAKAQIILMVSALLGLAFYICFWNQYVGLSIVIYFGLIVGATWLVTNKVFGQVWPRSIWVIVSVATYLSLMLMWRDSMAMSMINIATLFGLALVAVWRLAGQSVFMRPLGYFLLSVLPLWWIAPFFKTISQSFTKPSSNKSIELNAIFVGLAISLPIVLILLTLFMRADPTLGTFIGQLLNPFNLLNEDWISIIITTSFVAVFFAAAFSFILNHHKLPTYPQQDKAIVGATESNVVLGSINAVFIIYLLFQSIYLFGGQAYLETTATTYADYARSGFNELIWTAVIALGVIWLTKPHLTTAITALRSRLGLLLISQVLIVLASAISRLWLYEQAYGFTTTRLLAYAFAIWLCSVLLIVGAQIFKQLPARIIGPSIISSVVAMVIALNLLNPDAFIAQQNIDRYHQSGKIDLFYLTSLSADATPYVVELLQEPDQLLVESTAYYLEHSRLNHKELTTWQSWNWSRLQSQLILSQQDLKLDPNFQPPPNPDWQ